MQASVNGFFVHVSHDPQPSTDLNVSAAEKFRNELAAAAAEVRRAHDEAVAAGHGFGAAETVTPEETKAEAKAAEKPRSRAKAKT